MLIYWAAPSLKFTANDHQESCVLRDKVQNLGEILSKIHSHGDEGHNYDVHDDFSNKDCLELHLLKPVRVPEK